MTKCLQGYDYVIINFFMNTIKLFNNIQFETLKNYELKREKN
jgi:hypothetical protein